MKIIRDSREQLPYSFDRWPVSVQVSGIPTGDYSINGFEDKIAVERKSLNDLVSCLMGKNRDRFEKELTRARSYQVFAVVIEANLFQIMGKQYHSVMNPDAVMQSITAFYIRYGVPFLFAGDRSGGEYVTFSLLQKYVQEIQKRFSLYERSQRDVI